MATSPAAVTRHLTCPEGRAADGMDGAGPPIIMGGAAHGFGDQRAGAAWIAEAPHGQILMVPEPGHHPQSQRPDITTPAIIRFAFTVNNRA